MSDFPFKVGDKVRASNETTPGFHVTVMSAAHDDEFAGIDALTDMLQIYGTTLPWELYTPPPVRRRWTFETIDEVPNLDIQYIDGERFVTNRFGVHVPVPVVVPGTLREVAP